MLEQTVNTSLHTGIEIIVLLLFLVLLEVASFAVLSKFLMFAICSDTKKRN
jgi:hypothetical protein